MRVRGDDPSTVDAKDARRAPAVAAVFVAAVLAAGCASAYAAFPAEAEIPRCVALARAAEAVPGERPSNLPRPPDWGDRSALRQR